jgi:hypothetical protein
MKVPQVRMAKTTGGGSGKRFQDTRRDCQTETGPLLIQGGVKEVLANGKGPFALRNRDSQAWDPATVEKEPAVFYDLRREDKLLGVKEEATVDGSIQEETQCSRGFFVTWSMEQEVVHPHPDMDAAAGSVL